jgi:hypothetical protein
MQKYLVPTFVFLTPTVLLAQTFKTEYPLSLVDGVIAVLSAAFPLLLAVAVLYFVWGVVAFIIKAGDEKARIEGKHRMVWGIVSIVIILSVWGLVAVLQGVLKFGGDTPASYSPQASFGGGSEEECAPGDWCCIDPDGEMCDG